MIDAFSLSVFEPHVGSPFEVEWEDESVQFVLLEATDRTPAGFRGEQFSLVFAGPPDRPMPQGIRRLRHDMLGELDLFLVPVGIHADRRHLYEAFFNRLRTDDA